MANLIMLKMQRFLIAVALVFSTSSMSWAGLIKGDIVKFDRAGTVGGSTGGGEFAIHKLVSGNWQRLDVASFCLEFNEYVVLGERLVVGSVSDRAVLGGVGSGGLGDPLSAKTQFLYAAYASGQLSTAVTGYTRNAAWADSMQEAVWMLEGEITSFTKAHTQTLLTYANNYTGPLLNNVFALNLFREAVPIAALNAFNPSDMTTWDAVKAFHRQDQLYYVPPPITPSGAGTVPEPASLALWLSAGLMGSFLRFRRS